MNQKSLKQMQEEVDGYIGQFEEGYFSPLAMVARFAEEVGELAREVNHRFGEKPKKADEEESSLESELADILFLVICFANAHNIDLTDAFDQVMHKFETRDKDRWTKRNTEQ